MAQFGIGSPEDFFVQVLEPLEGRFRENNSDVGIAVSAIVMAYHLYEWAYEDKFCKSRFLRDFPDLIDYADDFEVARKVTNSIKHDVERIQSTRQAGFSSGFSEGFARPLVIIKSDGTEISVDRLLDRLVFFWREQRKNGWQRR